MRDTERERDRDTGRGRSRLHAGSLMLDSILGLQDQALGRRQRKTAEPPGLPCSASFYVFCKPERDRDFRSNKPPPFPHRLRVGGRASSVYVTVPWDFPGCLSRGRAAAAEFFPVGVVCRSL